jgi:hypothetical protein
MAAVASSLVGAGEASAARNVGFYPAHGGAPAVGKGPFSPDQCGVVTYCGGPVLSNVEIQPVYWTSSVASSIKSWAPGYVKSIVDSQFMDMLSEYSTAGKTGTVCGMLVDGGMQYFGPTTATSTNQTITRGTTLPAVTITPMKTTGNPIADDNAAIGEEIKAQIAAGKLPAPTYDAQGYPNTFYAIFFPSSVSITLQGGGSCQVFGGYHYSVSYTPPMSCAGHYFAYTVIPDCNSGQPDEAAMSHELAEAMSDADVGPTTSDPATLGDGAWYLGPTYPCSDPFTCPGNCGEIGDVCVNAGNATIPGTSISAQNIWSQVQNGSCDVHNPQIGKQAPPSGPPHTTCSNNPPPPPDGGTPDSGPGSDSGSGDDSGSGGNDSGSGGDDSSTGSPDSGGIGTPDSGKGGHVDAGGGGNDGGGSGDQGGTGSTSGCVMAPGGSGAPIFLLALGGFMLLGRGRRARRK